MKRKSLPILFTAGIFIAGLYAILLYAPLWRQPQNPFTELPRSYQAVVLASIGLVVLASMVSLLAALMITARTVSRKPSLKTDRLAGYLKKPAGKTFLIVIFLGFILVAGQMLLQISVTKNTIARLLLEIESPFFIWLILVSLICLLYFLIWTGDIKKITQPAFLYPMMLSFIIGLGLLVTNISGYGFQKDAAGGGNFRLTGFPLLDYQVLLAWVMVTAGSLIIYWFGSKSGGTQKISPHWIDAMLAAGIFLFAFVVWRGAPVVPNAFVDKPRPPNFQYYPNLDSLVYDRTALNLLASGEMQTYIQIPEQDNVGRRPLYTVYLAGLHVIAGNDYQDLINLQIGLFALLPVLIYLFTKSIHNRLSGVLAAVLLVIRNLNGVWLEEDVWGGTTLHMLMSDIQAMMFVVLFLYLVTKWMEDPRKKTQSSLIIGGVMGLGMLIRQELIVLLPVVCLTAVIIYRQQFRMILGKLLMITAGMVVVILPWLTRNALITGQIYLDKPGKVSSMIMKTFQLGQYSVASQNDISLDSDITGLMPEGENSGVIEPDAPGPFRSIGDHFANGIPQVMLYLPSNPVWLEADFLYRLLNQDLGKVYGGLFYSPYSYAKSLPYWWWDKWDGKIANKSWIYLSANIIFIFIGLYQTWKKRPDSVLLSFFTLAGMVSVYALIRRSGGRFIQTVDWISLMFLCIGLVHITLTKGKEWLGIELEENNDRVVQPPGKVLGLLLHGVSGWLLFLLIFLIGCSPIIAEIAIPNHYPDSAKESWLMNLLEGEYPAFDQEQKAILEEFLAEEGEALYGRALYPRYFPPDAALMTTNETLFPTSTTFTIAGTEMDFVVLSRLTPPDWFPQGTETLVIGCRESSYPDDPGFACLGCGTDEFEALVVVLIRPDEQGAEVLWRDGDYFQAPSCPLN